ncbi:MAG: Lrp/AsnC ligand binding domain-containing protein [Nitrososphaerales archaeon]
MTKAYVLIAVDAGYEDDVISKIRSIKGVVEAHTMLSGATDIIAEIERDDKETIREIVHKNIRKIPQVRSTQVNIVID